MKWRDFYMLLCFSSSFFSANGQHISGAMKFSNPIEAKDSNTIQLSYSNLFYFSDYEFFHQIQTGYTLFGSWQYPRISIIPNKWLKLEAGVLAQKDFGDNDFSKILPTFSLQLQHKDLRFLFGAIEGNQAHQLIEPLMNYDRVIERPIEEGFQFKINEPQLQTDIWLDWEFRQKINADQPEELTGGFSFSYTLTKPAKPWQIKIPLQIIISHKGGQLDTNHSVVSTTIDHAKGLWIEWNNPGKHHWLQQIRTDGYHIGYTHSQDGKLFPYNNGNGWLVNFYLQSKWNISLLTSYWKGYHYIAPPGGKLFQSVSSIPGRNYTEPERKLLFLNLLYEKEVFPGFFIDFRYTPYIDMKEHFMEHAFLLLFSYRKDFRLGSLK